MRLGLGSYSFRWSIGFKDLVPEAPMTPDDLLTTAAQHKLDVVQYADNIPLCQLSLAELDALKIRADELGIAIELGTQSFNAAQVRQYIGIARHLRADILRVALDGPDALKPINALADEFKALIPEAKDASVRIAVENHFNFPSERLATLLKSIDSQQVGACLDVANSICAGEWPMETVGILSPFAINLHLKDYVIVPDAYGVGFAIHGCPLGQGKTDAQAVLDSMPDDDNMSVILEHWLPRESDMADAREKEHLWLAEHVKYARNTLKL